MRHNAQPRTRREQHKVGERFYEDKTEGTDLCTFNQSMKLGNSDGVMHTFLMKFVTPGRIRNENAAVNGTFSSQVTAKLQQLVEMQLLTDRILTKMPQTEGNFRDIGQRNSSTCREDACLVTHVH